ncbi:threonine biosynthetic enzyme [Grosmannia clavigera kw1407]|uniref:Threonine dehydratase n=1 Tax=Grosmannia clavigera (strain kw1407 / UAMH 11150) TaxID=655863 RepID=F0XAD2_GROCL|nr:threonine biosynthetic enzyme [Grosmannia clavigera kw1407]EFX05525.1 threonine biosynthetic enzyme [Grosmannia clavigera kw1407]
MVNMDDKPNGSTASNGNGNVTTNGTTNATINGTANGTANGTMTPENNNEQQQQQHLTPSLSALSLSEMTVPSSPSTDERAARLRKIVPEEFILPNGHPDYLRLILTSRVYEVCKETSLTHAVNLSNRLECNVLLKREDEQPVFSFKLRGAYNKMAHLDPAEAWRGVVCCSAGNHAQGVAYSGRKLKIPATIVMPEGTPSIKHLNVSRMGGNVVLHGADFDAAKEECLRRGTIGLELLRQTNIQRLEAVFCCVGGGGLIAGVGVYIKRIAPHVKVIGVEAADASGMAQSLAAGHRVILSEVGLFADGAAVKAVGEETFRICSEVVDEIIQVSTDETCAAIKDVFEDTRSIVEPAGALALAGLKKYVAQHPSADGRRSLVAVTSGANMNFDRLRFIAERATLGEGKEALLAVRIPERPGSFAELIDAIMPHAVTEFSYRYASPAEANVLLGLSLTAPASQRSRELVSLLGRITEAGMQPTDVSGDELAKSHVRYLVGGRSAVADERLYMFNFPERPGALNAFLATLRPRYNISLFQYRNEGSDIGKVLTGILCPAAEVAELEIYLRQIGYPWVDCTESAMFKTFLRT